MDQMKKLFVMGAVLALAAMPLTGCGDDSDGTAEDSGSDHRDGDGDHADHGDGDAAGDGDHTDHDAGTTDGHEGSAHDSCGLQENCMDTVELAADLEVEGADGNFSVKVVSHNDLSVDMNEWTVQILDADGNAVDGADVTASTWSVDCGHGGPTPDEELTSDADGNVDVAPVSAHGGPWNAVFEISKDDTSDTVEIPLCIPGDEHTAATTDHSGHEG
jgi:hypothetical protein